MDENKLVVETTVAFIESKIKKYEEQPLSTDESDNTDNTDKFFKILHEIIKNSEGKR